ncbi:transmembrane protein 79 [Neosynchiropus ocellatus]
MMEDVGGAKTTGEAEEEEMVKSARTEPSTLQWSQSRRAGGQTGKGDRLSVRSDVSREAVSWTESERELQVEKEKREWKAEELAADKVERLDLLEDGIEENCLPEKAAQVFSPAVTVLPAPTSPTESDACWEQRRPFLGNQDYNQYGYQYDCPEETQPPRCGRGCPSRDVLKMSVSLTTAAIFFPFLVWGGFVFLPFDAPLLDSAPLRLVYTLRCSVFAALPIILGWLVLGISRLRWGFVQPQVEGAEKEAEHHEVAVHRRFVADSTSLFLIYFLQLAVMAMYLSQELLKLVPLLTIVFALGRLVYWVSAAFGSSIRGFGFGLSFMPSLVMMVANIYFIFTLESSGSFFSLPAAPERQQTVSPGRQRFWG